MRIYRAASSGRVAGSAPGSCLRALSEQQADNFAAACREQAIPRPDVWITTGLCPHAPDWLGARVSGLLAVPYVLFEPQIGAGTSELATPEEKASAKNSVKSAAAVVTTRSQVARDLVGLADDPSRLIHVLPFLDLSDALAASHLRNTWRNELNRQLGLPGNTRCFVTDGPQEPGPTLHDWRMLALALSRIVGLDWHVLVLGGGAAEAEVRAAMRSLPHQRVHYWREPSSQDRTRALGGGDLYVWPATTIHGLATLLEAQALGTPVVACANSDVADRVLDGQTGRLAAGNAESLSQRNQLPAASPRFSQDVRGEGSRDRGRPA